LLLDHAPTLGWSKGHGARDACPAWCQRCSSLMTIISLGYNQGLILSVMLRCGKNLVMAKAFARVLNIYEQKKKAKHATVTTKYIF
jgi:hypothetical protein